jgi:hypothetical protein
MGVLYQYFAAESDARAAAALDLPGGPAGAEPADPVLLAAFRAGDPAASKELRTPRTRWSEHGLQVLAAKGFDPVVQLARLEEYLTGVGSDEIIERWQPSAVIADISTGERMVISVTGELQRHLARQSHDDLGRVAAAWTETEEDSRDADAGLLAHFLGELTRLAQDAAVRGERLYCWVCV